jgi:steroid 5-alpha reductase family enzyme
MDINITEMLFMSLGVSAILFVTLWAISIFKKDASIVDIFWGAGCAIPSAVVYINYNTGHPLQLLLLVMVWLWAFRLGGYLAVRNLPHGEDVRYQHMRKAAGGDKPFMINSLFRVFILQCIIAWLISFPTQLGQIGLSGNELGLFAYIGAGVWFTGFMFEAVGDYQLRTFKKNTDNVGKIMDRGLWAWTRHPNYFGNSLIWFGIAVAALQSPYGIYAMFSPFVMAFFLVKISGKALLERLMVKKYPAYEAYMERTSGFLPLPPRNS